MSVTQADRDRQRLARIRKLRECLESLPDGWTKSVTIGNTVALFPPDSDEPAGFVRVTGDGIDSALWADWADPLAECLAECGITPRLVEPEGV